MNGFITKNISVPSNSLLNNIRIKSVIQCNFVFFSSCQLDKPEWETIIRKCTIENLNRICIDAFNAKSLFSAFKPFFRGIIDHGINRPFLRHYTFLHFCSHISNLSSTNFKRVDLIICYDNKFFCFKFIDFFVCVKVLVENGADINIKNEIGETALDEAKKRR